MAVCQLRTIFLIVCTLELIVTVEKQVFDFLGYMWLPIMANFMNILFIIFGCFGAVLYITKYLFAYAVWSFLWLSWNTFLICYFLNVGHLNRESGLLSLGTGSVSWWEGNGFNCQPVWGEVDGPGSWRPVRVDGCLLPWPQVELAQSIMAAVLALTALPISAMLSLRAAKRPAVSEKDSTNRRPLYTIELSPAETAISENSVKPMTPRRVKRRSGSRTNSSVRRSHRRSYRNAGYLASTASLPRDPRPQRPTSAHSSYSNFHAARPASYHADRDTRPGDPYDLRPREPYEAHESVPTLSTHSTGYDAVRRTVSPGYDHAAPYEAQRSYDPKMPAYENARSYDTMSYDSRTELPPPEPMNYGGVYSGYPAGDMGTWDTPPPPAPPYCARATPQAPGPPAYQPNDYNAVP